MQGYLCNENRIPAMITGWTKGNPVFITGNGFAVMKKFSLVHGTAGIHQIMLYVIISGNIDNWRCHFLRASLSDCYDLKFDIKLDSNLLCLLRTMSDVRLLTARCSGNIFIIFPHLLLVLMIFFSVDHNCFWRFQSLLQTSIISQ